MSTVVLASAGTGKTHTLVEAWLFALLGLDVDAQGSAGPARAAEPIPAERLLAITFTDKAAAEMRARVEARLLRLRFDPASEAPLLAAFAAAGRAVPDAVTLDAVRRSIARAPIGTFHAMCGRLLREHALAAGLDPTFRVLEADEELRMLHELAEGALIDALAGSPLSSPLGTPGGDAALAHDQLQQVVRELVARIPLRGIYEARGLTEGLVALHQALLERGLSARGLALADRVPVDVAAGRVRAAIDDVLAASPKATRAQQAKIQLDNLLALYRTPPIADGEAVDAVLDAVLDDDADVEAGLARLFGELAAGVGGNWGGAALTERRRALVDAVGGLGAALVDDAVGDAPRVVKALLQTLAERERLEKDQRAVLGFGDLLWRTRDLLARDKSVRARVKARFERVFVDEYQDTSPIQEEIVALLIEEPSAAATVSRSANTSVFSQVSVPAKRAFIVGDPKQSIYGFRGADADVFARAVRDLPGAVLKRLTVSRRSTPGVCAFSNLVLRATLPEHAEEALVPLVSVDATATAPGAPLSIHGEGPGVRSTEHAPLDATATAADAPLSIHGEGPGVRSTGEHAPLDAATAPDAPLSIHGEGPGVRSTAQHVASPAIGAWWKAGPTLAERKLPSVESDALIVADRVVAGLDSHAFKPEEVIVLVRRSRAAAAVGRALSLRGVPVRVVGGDGFWRRPEIVDLVSALALLTDPGDELAALTVLRSPLVAVPDDQLLALFEAMPDSGKGNHHLWRRVVDAAGDDLVDRGVALRVRAFDALLATMRRALAVAPLTQIIDLLMDEGGYAVACAVEPDAALRLRHCEKLRALCAGRPEEGVLAVGRLTDALDDPPPEPVLFDTPTTSLGPSHEHGVRVMTIHQSKGLEAEVVILADAGIALRGDSDDLAFDAAAGLAVSQRGRPIFTCTPKASSTSPTTIQRVRKAKRAREEQELKRLLYVALTRARRGVFLVGAPKRRGAGSLLGLIEMARDADAAAFDALVPPLEVEPGKPTGVPPKVDNSPKGPPEGKNSKNREVTPQAQGDSSATEEVTPHDVVVRAGAPVPGVPRLRASALLGRASPQLSMGLVRGFSGDSGDSADDDVLPPRARGRLAHAVIALVAAEDEAALSEPVACAGAVRAALRAIGAPDGGGVVAVDEDLIARLVRTLCGPVRALVAEGRVLAFEESLTLVTDVVVVECTADLVARGKRDDVVVEFKLSPQAAQAASATAQVQACCAALLQRGEERALRYAVWAVGEANPAAPKPFGPPARRELANLLARITVGPA